MNDYEVKIFNRVHSHAAPKFAEKMFVSTIITSEPSSFPAGSLIEINNETVRKLQSSTPVENFSRITYQLDVYATTKAKCRAAFAAVDESMIAMNFTRISGQYINNATNIKVFRYTARYEAFVDVNGNLYRVT